MLIETYVFFDIEATGLPQLEKNRTKITELTFLAVSRRDIAATSFGNIPFINKLSLLFNPQVKIQAAASKLTGLSNEKLQNQLVFKNKISCINSFLESLPNPVCLVAHNGNTFDYKILKAEYLDANESLPPDIYCVDSLHGFRKILKQTFLCYEDLKNEINTMDGEYLTDDEDEWPELNTTLEEWQELDNLVESFSNNSISVNSKYSPNSDIQLGPKSSVKAKKSTHSNKNSPLSPVENVSKSSKSENKQSQLKHTKGTKEKIVYKLTALYKRLLNKDGVEAHRAEADCIMLLECVVATKKEFLPYADSHCKLLETIEPLRRH